MEGLIFPALLVSLAILLWRNQRVFNYRMYVRDLAVQAAHHDLDHGITDFMWRFDQMESVTYDRMLWMFWKPLDRFYDDWSFIHPIASAS